MATKKSSTKTVSGPQAVIVEGSVTPAVGVLRRGERAAVALTANIEDLIAKGFIDLVGDYDDTAAPEATPITPEVPQGTDQGLVEATPPAPEPEPEVPNPDVDNSLVDVTVE